MEANMVGSRMSKLKARICALRNSEGSLFSSYVIVRCGTEWTTGGN